MINIPYYVADSLIPLAGKGLFVSEKVDIGRVVVAPTHISETITLEELTAVPDHPHAESSIRWFENHCTISPEWPDECFVNHSFTPSCLWHLGFLFAQRDLLQGEEITVDYRYLLGPEVKLPFCDSVTHQPIIGLSWAEKLLRSSETMLQIATQIHQREALTSAI
ncbi:SET domain-containing protein-lysine N-methyltransferase [Chrysiogenes arsenatis]|uniref:SET domain-containing protein-lysine N-methyltransferase n=1 Tax=Chrysiogenes arsenatis TaxID=309797 RepID=UPI0004265E9B|nr:SET domain-containing protein-lysine N-methyltransferase [Chrysiogenes arsenatis]